MLKKRSVIRNKRLHYCSSCLP